MERVLDDNLGAAERMSRGPGLEWGTIERDGEEMNRIETPGVFFPKSGKEEATLPSASPPFGQLVKERGCFSLPLSLLISFFK